MNEQEWMTSEDPQAMLAFLQEGGRASERKLRLFLAACARLVWDQMTDPTMRRAVETAERFADGQAAADELEATHSEVYRLYDPPLYERKTRTALGRNFFPMFGLSLSCGFSRKGLGKLPDMNSWRWGAQLTGRSQPRLLREIFGSPFRPPPVIDAAWLAWDDGAVARLARAAHEQRLLPSGHLIPGHLTALAASLETAGCTDSELLGHLRKPGPHVRGCFVLDALLGRG